MYVLRIVSMDKILCFTNTFTISIYYLLTTFSGHCVSLLEVPFNLEFIARSGMINPPLCRCTFLMGN